MWAASRPIVERWVQRELGPDAVARRAVDEAALGFAAIRRLPQTLTAIEAAARKVSGEAPREERKWYQMPAFWIGMLAGAVLALVLTAQSRRAPTPPPAEPAQIEEPAPTVNGPSATVPIPPLPPPAPAEETEQGATP
jgi:ubiquinone biosynthesis protein